MSAIFLAERRRLPYEGPGIAMPSIGAGAVAKSVDERLRLMRKLIGGPAAQITAVKDGAPAGPLDAQLKTKLTSLKRIANTVAMYLDPDWRLRLFKRLDTMMSEENWNEESQLPSEQSFSTFLRMIIYLHPTRRPSVGLSLRGHFIAAWRRGEDRIVIECLATDTVRWVLSRINEFDEEESGAGIIPIHKIPDVIAGYEPDAILHNGECLLT